VVLVLAVEAVAAVLLIPQLAEPLEVAVPALLLEVEALLADQVPLVRLPQVVTHLLLMVAQRFLAVLAALLVAVARVILEQEVTVLQPLAVLGVLVVVVAALLLVALVVAVLVVLVLFIFTIKREVCDGSIELSGN
jgi:hypothetical protein